MSCCEPPSEVAEFSELPTDARKPEATISLAQWMVGMNTSPRRIATAMLGSTAIALAANFLGVTSGLLSLFPEAAREQRLDIAYPVRGFKRHLDPQGRYTFIYPVRYVADQTVYMRNADAAYTRRTQDPMLAASGLRCVAVDRPASHPAAVQEAAAARLRALTLRRPVRAGPPRLPGRAGRTWPSALRAPRRRRT